MTIGIVRQVAVTGRAVNLLVCPCWGSPKMPSSDLEKPEASFCTLAAGMVAERRQNAPADSLELLRACRRFAPNEHADP